MSKFWVAGATGFLGAEIARQLDSAGHDLVLVSRGGGKVAERDVAALDITDAAAVEQSARGCEGAILAAGRVSRDPADAEALHQAHVVATEQSLLGLRRAGVRRVVCVSTSGTIAVGSDPNRIFTEEDTPAHELITRWAYYRSKYYAERIALQHNEPGVFEVIVVNPSLLLGPGDRRQSSTLDVRRFLAGSLPALAGGGLSFVDVRDAAQATIAAYDKGRPGQRYLISAANMPVATFFGRLSRLSGRAMPWARLPKKPALALASHWAFERALSLVGAESPVERETVDMGSHFWYCDSSKARRELGFEPRDSQTTLHETVRDILNEG